MRASRCGAVRTFQLLLAGATVGRYALEASCHTRFVEAKCIFLLAGACHTEVRAATRSVFFEKASCQTRFF